MFTAIAASLTLSCESDLARDPAVGAYCADGLVLRLQLYRGYWPRA